MPQFSARVSAFLDTPGRFAVLATAGADGTPHQAVTWYERRGATMVVNARDGRRWSANARRSGHLSLAVADAYDYVIVRGPVRVVEDQAEAQADIRALARRYGDDEAQFDGQRRVTFVLTPEHVSVHGSLAKEG